MAKTAIPLQMIEQHEPEASKSAGRKPWHEDSPSRPQPAAKSHHSKRESSSTGQRGIDAREDVLRHYRQSVPQPYQSEAASSISSRTVDSIDLEKGILGVEVGTGVKEDRSSGGSPSRTRMEMSERNDSGGREGSRPMHRTVVRQELADSDGISETEVEKKAMKLLFFFSGPIAALSLLFSIWTFISIIFAILLLPFRLCARKPGFKDHLISLLSPALVVQLQCMCAPTIFTDGHHNTTTQCYSLGMLVVVHLLAPVLAMGISMWAWIVAIYWTFAAMVGNPDGLDGRNDGRELVLYLRGFWLDGWLMRAVK